MGVAIRRAAMCGLGKQRLGKVDSVVKVGWLQWREAQLDEGRMLSR